MKEEEITNVSLIKGINLMQARLALQTSCVDPSSLNNKDNVVAITCSGAIAILGRKSRMKQTRHNAGGALEELLRAAPQTRN